MTMEERTQLIDELIQEDRDVTIGDYQDVLKEVEAITPDGK